jgi:hypothetical protein
MPLEKLASKRKRVTKGAVGALAAAGLTFGLAGGASASTTPTADAPQKLNFTPTQTITLGEEEIADVSLATFHLFDKERRLLRRLLAPGVDGQWSAVGQRLLRIRLLNAGEPTSL